MPKSRAGINQRPSESMASGVPWLGLDALYFHILQYVVALALGALLMWPWNEYLSKICNSNPAKEQLFLLDHLATKSLPIFPLRHATRQLFLLVLSHLATKSQPIFSFTHATEQLFLLGHLIITYFAIVSRCVSNTKSGYAESYITLWSNIHETYNTSDHKKFTWIILHKMQNLHGVT